MKLSEMTSYLSNCRWCNFKEEIRQGKVKHIKISSVPFDNGQKSFVLGAAELPDGKEKYFCMPLTKNPQSNPVNTLNINGEIYADAVNEPDFWKTFNQFIAENNGEIIFPNGWKLLKGDIGEDIISAKDTLAESKPLGVEQSNTTLNVGQGKYAFKLERMPEFSFGINSEFEMNDKLMREKSTVMPKTYGGYVWIKPDGQQAPAGIVQEFVPNRGDMWNVLQGYLREQLNNNYLRGRPLLPEEHPEFVQMFKTLGKKTTLMGLALGNADSNPAFTPEKVTPTFIRNYEKQMTVLLYQTKRSIAENKDSLPPQSRIQAEKLLTAWDEATTDFVQNKIEQINADSMPEKGTLNRVHGDFHLGQVIVTNDNDLKFVDFAGEPGLSQEERRQKYISVRDVAGMYRSINGYLGAVAVEEFTAATPDKEMAQSRRKWAEKAIEPLITMAADTFLDGKSLKEPWLALEVLRKNLYEVNYEVKNRPEMAYVPIRGLTDLLQTNSPTAVRTNHNQNGGKQ